MGMFDIDDSLVKETNQKANYDEQLRKAKVLCIRGEYAAALAIYNAILDKDFENEGALIGILRVHSRDFRDLKGEQLDNDIHAIESLYPNTKDPDYLAYKQKRNASNTGNANPSSNAGQNDSSVNNMSLQDLLNNLFGKQAPQQTQPNAAPKPQPNPAPAPKPAGPTKQELCKKYRTEANNALTMDMNYLNAVRLYEEALKYCTTDYEYNLIYPDLAIAYRDSEQPKKAAEAMIKAIEHGYVDKFDKGWPYELIASEYKKCGNRQEAIRFYKMAYPVTEEKKKPGMFFDLGYLNFELGNYKEAEKYYLEVINHSLSKDYTLASAYNNLAILNLGEKPGTEKNLSKAEEYTKKGAALGSDGCKKRMISRGWK